MLPFMGILVIFSAMLALLAPATVGAATDQPAPDLAKGRAAYQQHCARCHGVEGKGDGLDAKRFYPRPRDFSLGVYKFRSTVSGTPPSDEDLFRTITKGLPGTNMPDWQHVDAETRWQLVYYLKNLSPVFQQTQPAPVSLTADPGAARADLTKGRALYEQMGCAACHGRLGRADGTSAAGLVDDWGMKIRPANLTQGWAYRGGSDPHAVATRFLAGIDGTGMPSYAEAFASPEDVWHLSYYVASLQEPPQWRTIAHPSRATGPLPATGDDPQWASAERTDVPLRNAVTPQGEWAAPPTVRAVSFQAVYNEDAIAFRITWDDPSHGGSSSPDGLALALKPEGLSGDVASLQAWPYVGAPALEFCYWGEGASQASALLAQDFESLRSAGAAPNLPIQAGYADGRWQLVLQRPLQPGTPAGAVAMTPERFVSLAVVVWDGGNADARAVSPWMELSFKGPAGAGQHQARH